MPFNSELEDFAQAFSSGYGMVKSPQEREAEQLDLQGKRLEVERLPKTYEQQDIKFGLDVDIAKNQLADAAAARERKKITDKYEDDKHDIEMQYQQGLIDKQARDAAREKVDNAFNDANNKLILRKGEADASASEYAISEPVRKRAERLDEANIANAESTTASTEAGTAGKLTENALKKLELEEAERKAEAKRTLYKSITSKPTPKANKPRVIGGGVQPVPEEAVPAAPAEPGFTYTPPSAPAVGPVNTGNGATFPGAGATRGAGPEVPESTIGTFNPPELQGPYENAVPTDEEPGAAPEMVSDIFAGGVERKPIEQMQVPDDSTAVEPEAVETKPVGLMQVEDDSTAPPVRQRVIDHVVNGGGDVMPDGKKVLDVAGKEAVKDGLQRVIQAHGLDQDDAVDTPETEERYNAYLGGSRAASPDTVDMIEKTVEEQAGEELTQNEKTYYSLASTWLYYNSMGEPDAATDAAASLLQHYQMVFGQYTAVMKAAASNGDIDGAMEGAVRAYANVPTGDELHLSWTKDKKHIIATITDMDGVTTQRELMTPEEMGAFAMNVDPSSFATFIARAAGKDIPNTISPEAAEQMGMPWAAGLTEEQARLGQGQQTEERLQAGTKKPGALSAEQKKDVITDVSAAFAATADNAAKNGEEELAAKITGNTDLMMNIRPIAEQLAIDNPDLRPELAVEAVVGMVDQAPTSASIDGDRIRIKVEGSPEFYMDKDLYYRLADVRSKYAAPEDVTQEEYNQQLGDLRRTKAPGYTRPYDPDRDEDRIVEEFTPPATSKPSADHKITRPSEAVETKMPKPWIRQHPAVGNQPVHIPQWLLHKSVRPK